MKFDGKMAADGASAKNGNLHSMSPSTVRMAPVSHVVPRWFLSVRLRGLFWAC
jgi:hypothetical protein